ncbi:MAG TPA: kelch repeat-containing protein [Candidatus Eisenbacteria bacterium]|nr:kelch repeat-containing protein [Candidatus Eisenbacteria bacterium]
MEDVAQGEKGGANEALASNPDPPATGVTVDDGDWVSIPPPPTLNPLRNHTAIYDSPRDRMIVFGGSNDVWSLSLAGTPVWTPLTPAGTPPPARTEHTAIFDPVRERMIVFGGRVPSMNSWFNDVWAMSLAGAPTWSQLAPTGTAPPVRANHSAIYDPIRDRMVVFGGAGAGLVWNDVRALSLSGTPAWSIAASSMSSAGRQGHTAIYDAPRDRMIVFGGSSTTGYLNEVWALSFAGSPLWNQLSPAGTIPSARNAHTTIYDPARDRMVVFGGFGSGGGLNDLWALSFGGTLAWDAIVPTGGPPTPAYEHVAIYDGIRDRMVTFGWLGTFDRDNLWSLTLPVTPGWSVLVTAGTPPTRRYGHTAIYDQPRDRMVVFGGTDNTSYFNDVWSLSLSGNPTWTNLAPVGTPPGTRNSHTAIYDPIRERMVVFSGFGSGGYYADVWSLSLNGTPTWSQLATTGSPPASRYGHTAIYDPVRDRMVIFAGWHNPTMFNDVWALSLSSLAWTSLVPTGTPPAVRYLHAAMYDPPRDRMVVFSGNSRNDVWALSLAGTPAWSQLAPSGSLPVVRSRPTILYDPVRNRMVAFGGQEAGNSYRNDVWALSLPGSPAWTQLTPTGTLPATRSYHTAIYDVNRDRMLVFAGVGGGIYNDVWSLRWNLSVSVPGDVFHQYYLGPPRPNPSRNETNITFDLGVQARVHLDVFDVNGRQIKRIADSWYPVGHQVARWEGDDDRGHMLGAGVYFIRMEVGRFQATRRVVRIR